MLFKDALVLLETYPDAYLVKNNGRNEHHIQYCKYNGKLSWTAGNTVGGPISKTHPLPSDTDRGWEVFSTLQSVAPLS
jgi:hypothetical protein